MFNEQSGVCPYCRCCMTLDLGHDNTAEIEHIVPKSKGGTNRDENLIAACHECNHEKDDMSLREFLSRRLHP